MSFDLHHYLHTAHMKHSEFREMSTSRVIKAFAASIANVYVPYYFITTAGSFSSAVPSLALFYTATYTAAIGDNRLATT